jgi:peptide deformylase
MTALAIRHLPDPVLKQPTRPVERIDRHVTRFIDQLILTMRSHPRCVGIAAPQVGSPLRIAVMDGTGHPKVSHSHGLVILVNPQLVTVEGHCLHREGCLSIPEFTANVCRAERIGVRAQDRTGSLYTMTLDGFEAVIAQHELDHLDGRLFLDRVANLSTDVFRRKS